MAGENHYDYKGGEVELTCENCGDSYEVAPYREDSSRFCSKDCQKSGQEHPVGEDHPRYNGGKRQTFCENCGESFGYYKRQDGDKQRFCCQGCYDEAKQEMYKGEGNPVWRGGYAKYYGGNWDEQREAALERDDYTCQRCGVEASELDSSLHVHHKKRLGWFREEYDAPLWWQEANRLDNLVSLCPSCHKKVEWELSD